MATVTFVEQSRPLLFARSPCRGGGGGLLGLLPALVVAAAGLWAALGGPHLPSTG